MPKDVLKNRDRFSTSLDKEVVRSLKEFSKETMIPVSKILDMAIMEYIAKRKSPANK